MEKLLGGNYGWKILGWGGKNYIGTDIGPKWKKGLIIFIIGHLLGINSFVIYKGAEFSEQWYVMIRSLKYQNLYLLDYSDIISTKKYLLIEKELGRIGHTEVYIISNEYLAIKKKIK